MDRARHQRRYEAADDAGAGTNLWYRHDLREHAAARGAESGGHAEEADRADRYERRAEGLEDGEQRDQDERADGDRRRTHTAGEPAADRPEHHDHQRDLGRSGARVGGRQVVPGLQIRVQLPAERDGAAEADRVEPPSVPQVTQSLPAEPSRDESDAVGTGRSGRSVIRKAASTTNTASAAATVKNGGFSCWFAIRGVK